ncbi:MAG: hypothetical protein PHH54_05990 [Candidatus Nanoarchaeia archaeon]|nr:hypothetical protein [Candidatus Nanoarchaeia archaeon]MDD5741505.1 hypothetical protein [Candidatus Nanoarchaeia archaeon]
MYQTRVFTLEELTKPFFKDNCIYFTPEYDSYRGVSFETAEKIITPLGKIGVEFDIDCLHIPPNDFTIWFSNDKRKTKYTPPYMFCEVQLGVDRSDKEITSFPEVRLTLYHRSPVPRKLKDITLEGVRLSELREGLGLDSPESISKYTVNYFVKNMLSRMKLQPMYSFFENMQDLSPERKDIMKEKYKGWEEKWNKDLIRIGRDYAAFKMEGE